MDMFTPDLLILNAAQLVTPGKGWKLKVIKDGAVAVKGEKIAALGKTDDVLPLVKKTTGLTVIDAAGKVVCPGYVDPHTHLVYAGSRAEEFALRLQGMPYMEIAKRGGGINSTVKATRKASVEDLAGFVRERLARMLGWGSTTE